MRRPNPSSERCAPAPPRRYERPADARRRVFGWPAPWRLAAPRPPSPLRLRCVLLFGLPDRGTPAIRPSPLVGPQPASAAEAIRFALGCARRGSGDARARCTSARSTTGVFRAGDQVTFLYARDGSSRVTTRTVGRTGCIPPRVSSRPGWPTYFAYDARATAARVRLRLRPPRVVDAPGRGSAQDPSVTTEKHSRYVYTRPSRRIGGGPRLRELYGTVDLPDLAGARLPAHDARRPRRSASLRSRLSKGVRSGCLRRAGL